MTAHQDLTLTDRVGSSLTMVLEKQRRREDEAIDYETERTAWLELFGPAWSKMVAIIESVYANKYTVVRSANGVSKTHTATVIALWWLHVYRPWCKVISTAKTHAQVKNVLWARMRSNYALVQHMFGHAPMYTTEFYPDRKEAPDWFMIGVNPKIEGDEATAFQGHQSPSGRVLFEFEEAVAIPRPVFEAAEGSLRSNNARFLGILNPTLAEGVCWEWEQDGRVSKEQGNLITISAEDLFSDPLYDGRLSKIEGLVTPAGAQEMIDLYGDESPIVQARIRGEYPKQDERAVVTLAAVEGARTRHQESEAIGRVRRIIVPWDVAGEGADENVMGEFLEGRTDEEVDNDGAVDQEAVHGIKYRTVRAWHAEHQESIQVVQSHIQALKDQYWPVPAGVKEENWEPPQIIVVPDALGEGAHVPGQLRDLNRNHETGLCDITITPFKAGYGAEKIPGLPEIDLMNRISEAWYYTMLLLEKGWRGGLVADLDTQTQHELTTRRYYHQPKGYVPLLWYIEPKEEYKSRNRGRSPDHADAFVMGVWRLFTQVRIPHAIAV